MLDGGWFHHSGWATLTLLTVSHTRPPIRLIDRAHTPKLGKIKTANGASMQETPVEKSEIAITCANRARC